MGWSIVGSLFLIPTCFASCFTFVLLCLQRISAIWGPLSCVRTLGHVDSVNQRAMNQTYDLWMINVLTFAPHRAHSTSPRPTIPIMHHNNDFHYTLPFWSTPISFNSTPEFFLQRVCCPSAPLSLIFIHMNDFFFYVTLL